MKVLDLDRVLNLVCECGYIMDVNRRDGILTCVDDGCSHRGEEYVVPEGSYIILERVNQP